MVWGYSSGRIVPLLCCVVMLTGCGGDDGNTPSWLDWVSGRGPTRNIPTDPPPVGDPAPEPEPGAQPEPEPVPNSAPTIAGAPNTSVVVGATYSFAPKASDADGDVLHFEVQNKPSWATFDSSTGALTGTPKDSDVGTYPNIVIRVSDGAATAQLNPFTINVQATGFGTATLTWTAPTQRTDGSPLTNLSGYKVYWGTASRKYTESAEINNPGTTTYVVENLGPGTYYFATTAIASDGLESTYSNEASKTIQ